MIIETDTKKRIRLAPSEAAPRWNAFHGRWYAWGQVWIKSQQHWSSVTRQYNFIGFVTVDA